MKKLTIEEIILLLNIKQDIFNLLNGNRLYNLITLEKLNLITSENNKWILTRKGEDIITLIQTNINKSLESQ